ncbi:hypothetical protein JR316_0007939 [Psilocybe cubensis]|uniref:Uncharacterized protein n=2 Tax=Psilocybe cubensis TaxID=181762 RepID=A0A8H7XRU9_PSICU|nr:hypothetical protein JR316_0007939 [Psilocybe cubensis]KAH9479349.1 hypothetical protein JR316_0007939 [Psilocybe cubensis]
MGSNRVGSVFLGDFQRHRHLSSSTHSNSPPSSPPPTSAGGSSGNTIAGVFSFHQPQHQQLATAAEEIDNIDMEFDGNKNAAPPAQRQGVSDGSAHSGIEHIKPGKVDPVLALELRLRWLEALILGMKHQDSVASLGRKGKAREEFAGTANLKNGETLMRLTKNVESGLGKVVEGNDGLRKFMSNYDQNAHLLTPSFALSGILPDPPTYDDMTAEELNALLVEMEPDIRSADRDMLEIDALEKKGVTGAGSLPEYERLEPRLKSLLEAYEEDAKLAASLEMRISSLVERHTTYVDTLSELFVAWDDTLTEAEDKLAVKEREKAERLRLGFE